MLHLGMPVLILLNAAPIVQWAFSPKSFWQLNKADLQGDNANNNNSNKTKG